jgi:uncharacterized LabA/DUF88 family protein
MPTEPSVKRAVAFFDGQNLFYAVRDAFGYSFPNYDPGLLASRICQAKGWKVEGIYFYTGIPSTVDNPVWNNFWTKKLAIMGTRKMRTFSRPLRYRNKTIHLDRTPINIPNGAPIRLPDGTEINLPAGTTSINLPTGTSTVTLVGQEKGVDVRIALDVVRLALDNLYDIALIFSQDQDLTEAVKDVKRISILQEQWIGVACAFPVSPTVPKARGVDGTDWIRIDRLLYDSCLDPIDYRNS